MKFRVSSVGSIYTEDGARELEPLGFRFEQLKNHSWILGAAFEKAGEGGEIEFSSIEELMQFHERYGDIILRDGNIIIYDAHES